MKNRVKSENELLKELEKKKLEKRNKLASGNNSTVRPLEAVASMMSFIISFSVTCANPPPTNSVFLILAKGGQEANLEQESPLVEAEYGAHFWGKKGCEISVDLKFK